MHIFIILLLLLASFLPVFVLMPPFIQRMQKRKLLGIDMNKYHKPKVAELGGIVVWLGFSFSIILSLFIANYLSLIQLNLTFLLAAYSTISMVFFIGVIDDLIGWKKGLKQWQHALFPLFAALPLMAIKITNPPFFLPFIGVLPHEFVLPFATVSFGLIYSLFLVPIGITGASNATNMLAGLNGLEAGLGSVILFFLSLILYLQGNTTALIIALAMLGALLAFLIYNKYPAKVFGGDSLTLSLGATIASLAILGNIEKIAVLMMLLYFFEFVLKAKHKFQAESFGIPLKNGILKPPKEKASLTHIIMSLGRFKEPQITNIFIFLQIIISSSVFILYFLNVM